MSIPTSAPAIDRPGQRVSGRRHPNRNRPGDEDREREDAMVETTRDEGRKAFFGHDFRILTPGFARVSAIAGHWAGVEDATARGILAAQGAVPSTDGEGVTRYSWEDVWRMEGASYVPPSLYDAYRAPMIRAETLGLGSDADQARGLTRRGLVDLGPSQLRAQLARVERMGGPVVRLGPRLRLVRLCDLPELIEMLAAPRKVRRRPALSRRPAPDRGG
jgi:hypothetical protein